MGKHKKTKAQKILADTHHEQPITLSPATTPTLPQPVSYTFTSSVKSPTTTNYSLTHGLEKTLIVSSVIILLQLLLFILLHNHALVLPLVSLRY